MQAKVEFDRIAEEVNSRFFQGEDFGCIDVGEAELVARASEMARRGYRSSRESLDALKAYLEGYGILLSGDVGTGKTRFFDALGGIEKVSMIDLYAHQLDEIVEIVGGLRHREIVVDDIGQEAVYCNYGCRMDILPWLIEKRAESKMRTHFTTNLTGDELAKRYGARVFDRIYATCRMFRFSGKSMRETMANSAFVAASRLSGDWTICLERCANCILGRGCIAGIRVPPQENKEHPHPPQECPRFRIKMDKNK